MLFLLFSHLLSHDCRPLFLLAEVSILQSLVEDGHLLRLQGELVFIGHSARPGGGVGTRVGGVRGGGGRRGGGGLLGRLLLLGIVTGLILLLLLCCQLLLVVLILLPLLLLLRGGPLLLLLAGLLEQLVDRFVVYV